MKTLLNYGFTSKHSKILLFKCIILICLHILGLYLLNEQYGNLYSALQDYNIPVIWASITRFSGIAMILVLVDGYIGFFKNQLAFEIRTNITNKIYKTPSWNLINAQQIQEDTRYFADTSVEFYSTVFIAVVKLPVFAYIVASLTSWHIALILGSATIFSTYITRWLSQPQIRLQAMQEANEANFRKSLKPSSWDQIVKLFHPINREIKKLSFLQSGLMQGFVLLPFIMLMPMYISKTIALGGFMRCVNGLGKVVDSLTVLIDNRQLIVRLDTAKTRLEKIL